MPTSTLYQYSHRTTIAKSIQRSTNIPFATSLNVIFTSKVSSFHQSERLLAKFVLSSCSVTSVNNVCILNFRPAIPRHLCLYSIDIIMTTNLGPLTTIFTPPASCLSTITSASLAGFFVGHFSAGNENCYPPSTTTNYFATSYFYSPGICPSGYSAACTWPSSAFSAATTASLCCPMYVLSQGCLIYRGLLKLLEITHAIRAVGQITRKFAIVATQ